MAFLLILSHTDISLFCNWITLLIHIQFVPQDPLQQYYHLTTYSLFSSCALDFSFLNVVPCTCLGLHLINSKYTNSPMYQGHFAGFVAQDLALQNIMKTVEDSCSHYIVIVSTQCQFYRTRVLSMLSSSLGQLRKAAMGETYLSSKSPLLAPDPDLPNSQNGPQCNLKQLRGSFKLHLLQQSHGASCAQPIPNPTYALPGGGFEGTGDTGSPQHLAPCPTKLHPILTVPKILYRDCYSSSPTGPPSWPV